jgi:hypothetical protein
MVLLQGPQIWVWKSLMNPHLLRMIIMQVQVRRENQRANIIDSGSIYHYL